MGADSEGVVCLADYFENFILGCILINCVSLALYDPLETDDNSPRSKAPPPHTYTGVP